MTGWLAIWTVLLVVGAGVFAMLAVVVARGAAKDIRRMFKDLDQDARRGEDPFNDRR